MAKKFTEDELTAIIDDYHNGMKSFELAKKYNRNSGTIIGKLQDLGVYNNTTIRLSQDDVSQIIELYRNGDWDRIFEHYPKMDKNKIYSLMSNKGIKREGIFWEDEDVEFLQSNYNTLDLKEISKALNRSYSAIISKANKLGLSTRESWSDDELSVLKENYPYKTVDEMLSLLPKRNRKTIIEKASELKIKNAATYSDKDKQFVIDHYKNMTDNELSIRLNRTPKSISFLRYRLGLFKQSEVSCFGNFKEVFRKCIGLWKEKSMKQCNYKCVITGKAFDHIHHLYSFATICQEALSMADVDLSCSFDSYQSRMNEIIDIFVSIHDSYPLGVCLSKEIHDDFHRKYGNRNNTPQQWESFIKSYNG